MTTVLFVCTGNTCRSPMAEALMRKMLQDRGLDHKYTVDSCGALARDGDKAAENAVEVMAKRNIDLTKHKTKLLSQDLLTADIVLTMTEGHRQYIIKQFPDVQDQVYLLDEFIGGIGEDITDPFGGDQATYERVAQELEAKLELVIEKLENF